MVLPLPCLRKKCDTKADVFLPLAQRRPISTTARRKYKSGRSKPCSTACREACW